MVKVYGVVYEVERAKRAKLGDFSGTPVARRSSGHPLPLRTNPACMRARTSDQTVSTIRIVALTGDIKRLNRRRRLSWQQRCSVVTWSGASPCYHPPWHRKPKSCAYFTGLFLLEHGLTSIPQQIVSPVTQVGFGLGGTPIPLAWPGSLHPVPLRSEQARHPTSAAKSMYICCMRA